DAMRVRSVEPETLFARGGLEPGDRIVAVGGLPIRSPREWSVALANVEAERPEIWQVLRNGNPIELTVIFPGATWENRIHSGVVEYCAVNFSIFLFGIFIGFCRPRDLATRIGAWLFLTASIAFGFMNGWAVIWRQAPIPVQFGLWIPELSRFIIEGIFLSFFLIFPRPLFRVRWPWLLICIPVLATLPWRIAGFYSVIYRSGQTAMIPDSVNQLIFLRTMAYVAAGLVFLLVNY